MLGEFPSWVDVDFVKNASTGLIIGGAAIGIICLIMLRSLAARLIILVLVVAGGFGLYQYRETISDCESTCSCELFGEEIPGGDCLSLALKPQAPLL